MTTTTTSTAAPTGVLIDGQWAEPRSRRTFDDLEPATGERLAQVAAGGPEDVSLAVAAALQAFRSAPWARINPTERGRALYRLAQLVRDRAEEFARLEAADVGKLLDDARSEVELSASLLEYYAGAANKVLGETYQAGPGKLAYTLKEPLGVVAAMGAAPLE